MLVRVCGVCVLVVLCVHYLALLALCAAGCLTLQGGDHTIVLPILRALAEHHGRPIGVVHVDAHSDTNNHMFDEPIVEFTYIHGPASESASSIARS